MQNIAAVAASTDDDRRGTGAALLAKYVNDALEERRRGDHTKYNGLLQQLTTETNRTATKRWLRALTQCVSSISRSCFEIVDAALSLPWAMEDQTYGNIYIDFVENLLSANAYYTAPCVHMLVLNLTYRTDVPNAPKQPTSLTDKDRLEMYNRVHQALFTVMNIVPTATTLLMPILAEYFPHKRQTTVEHLWYMRNIVRVLDYVPEIVTDALGLILDRIIQIDVEIQVDLEQLEDDGDDQSLPQDLEESEVDDDEDGQAAPSGRAAIQRFVDKLDQMLLITFEYLDRCIKQLERPNQQALLEMMLGHFERTIMTTHRSRYTQFLIFYVSSRRSDFPDIFLSFLIHVLVDPQKSAILRQAAAAYIAGFVCRCKRVPIDTVIRCIDLMFQWAHAYVDHCEESVAVPDASRFGLFYHVCMALFYIICFRHRQLLALRDGSMYIQRLGFDRLINSKFNPLKVCLQSVVNEFARITEQNQLVYCYTVMNRNKRLLQQGGLETFNDFDSFFVFEPYRLKLTSRYIDAYYQEWEDEDGGLDDGDVSSSQPEDSEDSSEEDMAFEISSEMFDAPDLLFRFHNGPDSP